MAPSNRTATNAAAEIAVEKWVYGGDGLSRLDGQVVLTPFVLPGEIIEASLRPINSGLLRGETLRMINPAPDRVPPGCVYFTRCGGCQYQHAPYEFQLSQKVAILRETLRRIGGLDYPGEINVISAEPWKYRNRVQLHFADGRSGFHRAGSHDLCAVNHCPISSPAISDAIRVLSDAASAPQWPRFLRSAELFSNGTQLQLTIGETDRPVAARFFEWCQSLLPSLVPGAIDYAAAGSTFRISRGSFFQVNRFLIDALVQEVLQDHRGNLAVDLYAGVGLFSLPLSARFEAVTAVERGGQAFKDLEWNARETPRVRAAKGASEDFLSRLDGTPDLIVADPPRAGLGAAIGLELLRLQPPRLTIVSCNPATLGRDLKGLLDTYQIERLTCIDLFPQTFHLETVIQLRIK